MIIPEIGRSEVSKLRVDFFPTSPKLPASRRTTRLTTHKEAETVSDIKPSARYFVQCNCACK